MRCFRQIRVLSVFSVLNCRNIFTCGQDPRRAPGCLVHGQTSVKLPADACHTAAIIHNMLRSIAHQLWLPPEYTQRVASFQRVRTTHIIALLKRGYPYAHCSRMKLTSINIDVIIYDMPNHPKTPRPLSTRRRL